MRAETWPATARSESCAARSLRLRRVSSDTAPTTAIGSNPANATSRVNRAATAARFNAETPTPAKIRVGLQH
ncbi:MAG: hypothetical protein NVS4B10_03500 [Myxococcales bacterium]